MEVKLHLIYGSEVLLQDPNPGACTPGYMYRDGHSIIYESKKVETTQRPSRDK